MHAIQVIRYLNCTLPIELFYFGDEDLPLKMRHEISKLENVKLIDMEPFLRKDGPKVGGWSTKPLAMLFSQFQEVIFMDSDTLFFHDPQEMFSWYRYMATGTLYFRDRTVGNDNLIKFLKTMAPEPSDMAKQGRVWQGLAGQEGESGVIVIDKRRGGFFTLLMASLLNMEPYESIRSDIFVGGETLTYKPCESNDSFLNRRQRDFLGSKRSLESPIFVGDRRWRIYRIPLSRRPGCRLWRPLPH
jgi:hypothetical protein